LDTALAFLYLPLPQGRNAALIGAGGGASVSGVDDAERSGLTIPPFSSPIREELEKLIPPLGTSMRNPVDLSYFLMLDPKLMLKTVKIAANDPKINFLILFSSPDFAVPAFSAASQARKEYGRELQRIQETIAIPLVTVSYESATGEGEQHLFGKIPVYPTMTRAAEALSNVVAYTEYLQRLSGEIRSGV
jgi:acyl-CoA synthetase (NDP forming)